MAVINRAKREINAKIVYYGPAGSGKGSLLRFIHQRIKPSLCGPLKSMPAGGDTLLFFDYLPFETNSFDGYQIRFHLYTLTGPVTNPGTWKMTLKGVDGLALVSEAGQEQSETTRQALRTLQSIVAQHGRDLRQIPSVLISSKADQTSSPGGGWATDMSTLSAVSSSVQTGEGVLQALAALSQAVVRQVRAEQEAALSSADRDVPNLAAPSATGGMAEDERVCVEPEAEMAPAEVPTIMLGGQPATLRLPIVVQVAGEARRCTLRVTLDLEEVGDGAHNL